MLNFVFGTNVFELFLNSGGIGVSGRDSVLQIAGEGFRHQFSFVQNHLKYRKTDLYWNRANIFCEFNYIPILLGWKLHTCVFYCFATILVFVKICFLGMNILFRENRCIPSEVFTPTPMYWVLTAVKSKLTYFWMHPMSEPGMEEAGRDFSRKKLWRRKSLSFMDNSCVELKFFRFMLSVCSSLYRRHDCGKDGVWTPHVRTKTIEIWAFTEELNRSSLQVSGGAVGGRFHNNQLWWAAVEKPCMKRCFRTVAHQVVDIDPQGSNEPSKGSVNSHGIEWGSPNGQGQWITAGVYWCNEASNSKLLLIGQRMQTTFFNNQTKLRGLIKFQLQ